jgi:hypothetical protein
MELSWDCPGHVPEMSQCPQNLRGQGCVKTLWLEIAG